MVPAHVHLPISEVPSILVVANLLLLLFSQISLLSVAVNCSFSDNLIPLGLRVPFILLPMVRMTKI